VEKNLKIIKMSIEYFVEGKVTKQIKGDYSVYSKEIISHNSTTFVEQKGIKDGIKYNKPKKLNPNNKPIPSVNITLNLFFDGTANNKTNVEAGYSYKESDGNDSFANDFSNVVRGYDAIDPNEEMQVKVYVEGIGTVDLKSDNDWTGQPLLGGGLGDYDRGIEAKVTKGCIKSAKAIKNKKSRFGNKTLDTLIINVFGFSRGAAAARHFLHVANSSASYFSTDGGKIRIEPLHLYEESIVGEKTKDHEFFLIDKKYKDWVKTFGYFGACLVKNELFPKHIIFNFAGLYDTVASFGFDHRGKWLIRNDTKQLGLTSVSKSRFIFQIAADDEYRDNFDLTNIDSCGLRGLEITLPGVHSDIGGGYKNGHEQLLDKYKYESSYVFKSSSKEECEKFKRILITEGWFKSDRYVGTKLERELTIHEIKSKVFDYNYKTTYELRGKRLLSNQYDKIPLNQMLHYSKQFNVKYDSNVIKRNHEIKDVFIKNVNNQLLHYINVYNYKRNEYVSQAKKGKSVENYISAIKSINYRDYLNFEDLKKLRNQYFHWSVNLDSIAMVPRIDTAEPAENRKRNIQNG